MNPASRIRTTARITAFLLATFLMAGNVMAIDQPPQDPQQQRTWLVGHLATDMEALGTFDGNALAKVPGIVNALTDDQVALLSQYYFLTRSKTQQDAYLYSLQQQGDTDEQVNAAKAEIADLLTAMNDQTVACYDQFVPMPEPVQYLAQSLLRQRAGLVLPCPVLRPRVVLRQRLLRRAVLQRRLLGHLGGAGLPRLLRPRQPFLRALPQRRQHRLHQPQHRWRNATPTGSEIGATGRAS